MWNEPKPINFKAVPKLYETEYIKPTDTTIYLHFFIGGSDWYIAEYDGKDIMFGFAILNGDEQGSEWGYVSLKELKSINIKGIQVDRDLHWTPKPAKEVPKIKCF